MAESHSRTLICSVLFIDIVEYSRKPVVEQIELKDRFNALLSDALKGVAVSDRIILDTGDGAAISFIGDPEDALFVAADLRDAIGNELEAIDLELSTRMGVNLGPVRLVKDINGQPNIIGDGINVAQRVMSFAKPGQVLVSRSYYEVVSRLSEESSKLFTYEGSRTDKHIREHEVYGVGDISALHRRTTKPDSDASAQNGRGIDMAHVSRMVSDGVERIKAQPRVATVVAVAVILTLAIGLRMLRAHPEPAAPAPDIAQASDQPPSPMQSAYVPSQPAQSPAAPAMQPKEKAAVKTHAVAPTALVAKASTENKRAAPSAPAETKRSAVEERSERTAPIPEAVPQEPAMVSLAISPWGQVFVNGKMRGVSPPLQELELTPGKHRIEVRNTGSATHVVSVNAKAGERLRIKHKFE